MVALHPEFVVDKKAAKKAVILPFAEWRRLMEEIEELEDIRAYDKAKGRSRRRPAFRGSGQANPRQSEEMTYSVFIRRSAQRSLAQIPSPFPITCKPEARRAMRRRSLTRAAAADILAPHPSGVEHYPVVQW